MLHLLHFLVSQYDLATIIPAPSPTAVSSATATAAGAVAANTDESGAKYNVNKRCEIAENYNLHDADEQQQLLLFGVVVRIGVNWIRYHCGQLSHLMEEYPPIEDSTVDDGSRDFSPGSLMKELIGIMDLADMLAKHYGLKPVETQMNVTLFEDNAGVLVLAKTLPPEFTPRSKFYHIETIWVREQINLRGIKVEKIDTHEQLGDIFTKGLSREVFEYLREKLCGW
eukprot:CAMPEP_0201687032 /NCGR_PEP_ID=MMETSP0578-20130828/1253_1 /ASSEMBLY_ACC=CAM_ASM_000663 /TAXON_ID=267565 /ORGANISM="Skeletonema grethea, Strain CCMP 1804" /LENGTH=225 /DNA_ID=CAMNT_0048171149 /DNA_START=1101 /DNA_END=1776 /DNA_ORIENTATION=+